MRTATERREMQQEALSRAVSGQSWTNYTAIFQGFVAKGIPENEILPRENVFTYHAWRALGRQVRRGEHGVKVTTFVPMEKKTGETDPETGEEKRIKLGRRAWTAVVFHVSQTDAISK
jgi:antirestriction protein ArdC